MPILYALPTVNIAGHALLSDEQLSHGISCYEILVIHSSNFQEQDKKLGQANLWSSNVPRIDDSSLT